MNSLEIPRSESEFSAIWSEVAFAINVSARLPDWPFVQVKGHVAIGQYERLLGTDFVPVLEGLAAAHDDSYISLATIDPDPAYYSKHYRHFPGFRVARDALADDYWSGLSLEPGGDPTGAVAYTANVVGIVGSSHAWSVWGQRYWDLVLVHTQIADGPWLRSGFPFVSAEQALTDFTAPPHWQSPFSEAELSTFLGNFRERGTAE
jgi:hypothetical protein